MVALPDNHLQYALTWFGLALALGGVYVTWLARRLRSVGYARIGVSPGEDRIADLSWPRAA